MVNDYNRHSFQYTTSYFLSVVWLGCLCCDSYGGDYNIGINGYLVLLSGAYIKTPIDLTSTKKPFGDKQAFNAKTLLLTLPKLFLPMILYFVGSLFGGEWVGYMTVAFTGILGYFLKNKVFDLIETLYKTEKHKTLKAYKQNT